MNFDDVLALVRAGYTRAEIDSMMHSDEENEAAHEENAAVHEAAHEENAAVHEAAHEENAAVHEENAAAHEENAAAHDDSAVLDAINKLTLALQAQNRANATVNTVRQSAEEALASGVFGGGKK